MSQTSASTGRVQFGAVRPFPNVFFDNPDRLRQTMGPARLAAAPSFLRVP